MATAPMKPIALTIDISAANAAPPKHLLDRLAATPPSSPDSVAKKEAKAEAIHKAHVENIKARAARDLARVADAEARKLRLLQSTKEGIQRRFALADIHMTNHREAETARREAAKTKRLSLAEQVQANRLLGAADKERRAQELKIRTENAHARRNNAVNGSAQKASAAVAHAKEVAKALKEKEQAELAAAQAKLEEKLSAAAARREAGLEASKPSSPATGPSKDGVRHRVFNDLEVAAGLKRRSLAAAMEKAAANRESKVQEKKDKASKHIDRVAERAQAKEARDAAAHSKAAWTQKMVAAEIGRLHELKKRYGILGKAAACPALVVIGDFSAPLAMPAPRLLKRLTAAPKALLATATARQAMAASRRTALAAARSMGAANAALKHAAAAGRRAKLAGDKKALADAHVAASERSLATRDAARKRHAAASHARVARAAKARAAAVAADAAKAAKFAAVVRAAGETHAAQLKGRAKAGGVAAQAAGFAQRRAALVAAQATKGTAKQAKCDAAFARRAALLEKRAAKATAKRAAKSLASSIMQDVLTAAAEVA